METFTEQLRQAIRDSKLSRYALCQLIGFDQGNLSKFMSGKIGLSLETVEKLVEVLNLELAPRSTPEDGDPARKTRKRN